MTNFSSKKTRGPMPGRNKRTDRQNGKVRSCSNSQAENDKTKHSSPHGRANEKDGTQSPAALASKQIQLAQLENKKKLPETVALDFNSDHEADQAPVLPGIKPVLELLQSSPGKVDAVFLRRGRHGKDMEKIVDLCRTGGVRFSLLESSLFSRIYPGPSQGVVARLFETGYLEIDELLNGVMDAPLPLITAFDQVQDPGNAGTLARTLYALGGAGLIIPRHNGVYLGAAAAKASAGALEKLPVAKVANLGQAVERARKLGFTIYGASCGHGNVTSDLLPGSRIGGVPVLDVFAVTPRMPAILILGNEETGMRQGMEKRCDFFVKIPMLRDFDSLNVAQAGAIIISWFAKHAIKKPGKSIAVIQ